MMCGFRPFFLATALWGALAMLLWMAMLVGWLSLPGVPLAGPVWHAHEMVWGFGMAAAVGFLLTAVPEFTVSAAFTPRDTAALLGLWLVGRLLALLGLGGAAQPLGTWLAAGLNLALVAWLAWRVVPRLLRQHGQPHWGFSVAVAALALLEGGFWYDTVRGGDAMRWVNASVGLMMILIVLAQSRISMRLMHGMLDDLGVSEPDYRAPPPRRRLAIVCIVLASGAELLGVPAPTTGWLCLATAAAALALMTEWHLGRTLLHRWVWPMYAVYACMAAGYALLGAAYLGAPCMPSAGRHLLTAGSMGLGVLAVMNIAGRIHAGRALDDRRWRIVATLLLIGAAGARVVAASPIAGAAVLAWWWAAALMWVAGWLLFAIFAWHHLTGPRTDGGTGCEEPLQL